MAEDGHEDERRQEAHRRQQRQRGGGAGAGGEAREVAPSAFQVTDINRALGDRFLCCVLLGGVVICACTGGLEVELSRFRESELLESPLFEKFAGV